MDCGILKRLHRVAGAASKSLDEQHGISGLTLISAAELCGFVFLKFIVFYSSNNDS
jgi:hypothetical protein